MKTIASVEYILQNGDKRKYYCGKVDFWTNKINPNTYIVYESSRPKQASKTNLANRREVVCKQATEGPSVCLSDNGVCSTATLIRERSALIYRVPDPPPNRTIDTLEHHNVHLALLAVGP